MTGERSAKREEKAVQETAGTAPVIRFPCLDLLNAAMDSFATGFSEHP
jgi:hypothetical protein